MAEEQKEKTYVGNGWASQYGIGLKIKREDFLKLPIDKYGQVSIYCGQRRNGPDPKTKATHWVAWNDYQPKDKNASEGGPDNF